MVQDIFSRLAVEQHLRNLFPSWATSEILLTSHRTLWAENGDALSRIYAGTGALNTSFTRSGKRTLAGALSDATKSVSRMYISNFVDKGKQTAIDGLLVRAIPFSGLGRAEFDPFDRAIFQVNRK